MSGSKIQSNLPKENKEPVKRNLQMVYSFRKQFGRVNILTWHISIGYNDKNICSALKPDIRLKKSRFFTRNDSGSNVANNLNRFPAKSQRFVKCWYLGSQFEFLTKFKRAAET